MQEWKKEFRERFKNSHWFDVIKNSNHGMKGIKAFIQAQIDKARAELAREIIEWIEGEGTLMIDDDEVYYVTPNDIDQLKAKYEAVE